MEALRKLGEMQVLFNVEFEANNCVICNFLAQCGIQEVNVQFG